MANQSLVDYIRKNKDKYPVEQLKTALINQGWPKDAVEEAANSMDGINQEQTIGAEKPARKFNLLIPIAIILILVIAAAAYFFLLRPSGVSLAQGESKEISVGGVSHSIQVDEITADSATITISSTPQTLTLKIGEEKEIDLDGKKTLVKLEKIENGKAFFSINAVKEAVTGAGGAEAKRTPIPSSPQELCRTSDCYYSVASILKKPDLCEKSGESCYQDLAVLTKNADLCNKLPSITSQEATLGEGSDVGWLYPGITKEICRQKVGILTKNPDLCSFTYKDRQLTDYTCLAIAKNDINLCADSSEKEFCFNTFAEVTGDISACENNNRGIKCDSAAEFLSKMKDTSQIAVLNINENLMCKGTLECYTFSLVGEITMRSLSSLESSYYNRLLALKIRADSRICPELDESCLALAKDNLDLCNNDGACYGDVAITLAHAIRAGFLDSSGFSPSTCERIDKDYYSKYFGGVISKEDLKNNCYENVAEGTNDASLCGKITGYRQLACYENIALSTNDPSVCGKINNESLKNQCYDYMAESLNETTLCSSITNEDNLYIDCNANIAFSLNTPRLCDKIQQKYSCYLRFCDKTTNFGSVSVIKSCISQYYSGTGCEDFTDPNEKDGCYLGLATESGNFGSKNSTFCDMITVGNTATRADCYEFICGNDEACTNSYLGGSAAASDEEKYKKMLQDICNSQEIPENIPACENAITECEQNTYNQIEKTDCYIYNVAVWNYDVSLCEKITTTTEKDNCYDTFARNSCDASLCEKIQDATSKQFCKEGSAPSNCQ